jgi:hypothetical protein
LLDLEVPLHLDKEMLEATLRFQMLVVEAADRDLLDLLR